MGGMENKPALWKNSSTVTYFKYLVLFQYLGLKSYFMQKNKAEETVQLIASSFGLKASILVMCIWVYSGRDLSQHIIVENPPGTWGVCAE